MRKFLAVTALAAVGLAACGSSGSKGSSGTTSGGVGGTGGGNSAFATLVAKAKTEKYKVTYQSGTDTPFTIAQDPPRFGYVSGDSSTYVLADGSAVSCSGTGSTATCTALPGTGDVIKQGLTSAFGAIGAALFAAESNTGIPGLGSIAHTTTDKIAGRDALCATIDSSSLGVLGAAIKGSYSVCIDKDTGVMLKSSSTDESGKVSSIEATAFGEPTAADVTPPATPQTIPTFTPPTS